MEKPVDMDHKKPIRAVVGRTKLTGLHPKRSTDPEHRDEQDEGGESGWRRLVSWIPYSTHDDE